MRFLYLEGHILWSLLSSTNPGISIWLKKTKYKKMSFLGKIAITTLKLIQNANVGGALENSGYLLPNGHWDFQNWRRNDWENEA